MLNKLLPFFLLLSLSCGAQIIEIDSLCGSYNVKVGVGAGDKMICEHHCVVVGHDSVAQNTHGKNLVWYVDYTEPYLPKCLAVLLKTYEPRIGTDKDNYESRRELALTYFYHIYNKRCIFYKHTP